MRIRPLLLVALLLVSGMWTARSAAACTCGPFDTRKVLSEAPAAFVGRLITRDPFSEGEESTQEVFRFQVDQRIKGDLEPIVAVHSEKSEASCGLSVSDEGKPFEQRTPVGIILSEVEGRWHSNLCRQTSPERLTRAAQDLPPADADPPPDIMLASTYGAGRATGLRFNGRITAYGAGPGRTLAASSCPDRKHVAELFVMPTPAGSLPGVAVRAADSMAVVFERMLPEFERDPVGATALACRSAEGRDVVVAARLGDDETGRSHIIRVNRPSGPGDPAEGTAALIWQGEPYKHAAFAPGGDVAYLGLAPSGERLMAVDLAGPNRSESRPIADLPPGAQAVTVSPDGLRLATVAVSPSQPSKVATIDLRSPVATPRIYPLPGVGINGQMLWAGNDRVVFTPRIRPDVPVLVFDTDMRVVHSWSNWVAERSLATAGGLLYGAGPDPAKPNTTLLRQAALDTGVIAVLREIEDALVYDMVDLSDPNTSRAGSPTTPGKSEVSTTTTTVSPSSSATRPTARRAPSTTVTTAPSGTTATSSAPIGTVNPTPSNPKVATTTTTPAGERLTPSTEEEEAALPAARTSEGGDGWLNGWILLVLVLGVGGAVAAAAILSGGLTAMPKRGEGGAGPAS